MERFQTKQSSLNGVCNAFNCSCTITADFRNYPCVEDSIADHSAYRLGAKNGSKLRDDGLKGCTDYKKAAQIIKDGGYATSLHAGTGQSRRRAGKGPG